MERNSPAIVLSREEDAVSHGYVLYGLVKPDKKGKGIESAAAMVNVIPRKRIYRMDEIEELEMFRDEILKRPLVMQPTVLSGKGLQKLNCFFFIEQENWVAMINQNHPKIQGRIMMGIDAAKKVMNRGEPFILEFIFSDVIRRLYLDGSFSNALNIKNKFTDCEHGDLIIRYGGDGFHRGMSWEMKARHMRFSFEDIDDYEIQIRTLSMAECERRSAIIQVIPDRELQQLLPGWSFNQAEEEEDDYEDENYDQYYEDDYYGSSERPEAALYPQGATANPGRIKGRANRGKATPSKYEVSVELHVPSNEDIASNHNSQGSRGHENVDRQYENVDRRHEPVNRQYENVDRRREPVNRQYENDDRRYEDTDRQYADVGRQNVDADGRQDTKSYSLYSDLKNERSDHDYPTIAPSMNRYNHYHQGSGRSGSSNADSGYEENDGGFEDGKYGLHKNGNKKRFQNSLASPDTENQRPAGPHRYNDQNHSSVLPLSPAPRSPQPPRSDRYNDSYNQNYRPSTNNKDRYNYDNQAFTHENYSVVEESVERNKAIAAKMLHQNNYKKLPPLNDYRSHDTSPRKTFNYQQMPTISQSVEGQQIEESVI